MSSFWRSRQRRYRSARVAAAPSEKAVGTILRSLHIVNPAKILQEFKTTPANFDFKNITPSQVVNLLAYDFDLFAPHLDVNSIAVYEKVRWLSVRPDVAFTYIDLDKLPSYAIDELVTKKPMLADIIDLPLHKLSHTGWQALMNHNRSYIFQVVRNLSSIRNKSNLRKLIVSNVDIFPALTIDAMRESVISAKEWALLLKWPDLKGLSVKYDPDVTEWLDQEILTEILLGNAKTSKQLNTALSLLRS
jgi:hypothetical protein